MPIYNILAVAESAAHGASEATGNPIVDLANQFHVEWPFLIAQIINFCIVAFILYRFAFKPILATVDQRQQKIAEGLQYAEEMKAKLAEAEKKEAETLRQAREEAKKILEETRQSAKVMMEKNSQDAIAKAEQILLKAEQRIAQERIAMFSEVRQEIARLVVLTTGKVLRKELTEQDKTQFNESAARELAATES